MKIKMGWYEIKPVWTIEWTSSIDGDNKHICATEEKAFREARTVMEEIAEVDQVKVYKKEVAAIFSRK